jgi:hypothetical protein
MEENFIDKVISIVLKNEPFSSIWQIARKTLLSTSTIYRHWTSSMDFVVKCHRWIPHNLSDNQNKWGLTNQMTSYSSSTPWSIILGKI